MKGRISSGYLQQAENEEIWPLQNFEETWLGNAYEVELLDGINISPIFNITDLIEYHDDDADDRSMLDPCPIPTFVKKEIEEIMDSHVGQSTTNR